MLSAWHGQDGPGKAGTALVTGQKLELGPTELTASFPSLLHCTGAKEGNQSLVLVTSQFAQESPWPRP